ncbi:hypothetical protein TVAG_241890 [Trichomonas vaginalis G3]|uniref:Uncharacterized protein n=1 Tax=Trichomonas vaginalis (strain ATCC PRA-98 / G3) TaxID=412133 RepID=A2FKS8_TRIV3|nr:hypothetical protein TVAGG3_0727440 [Trichomonas vaginalis G3]EAX94502.1 hypothetical protein TVAG_241890 [Trichomonas vaginalis G3]KAI5511006.1 hypothetical protein TVAGG3_0727440 [Trichomonas vaginalis G3]|eukprot:XP_001307432.1 hypothetical protein [Trichomonas vaginalis G3]
MSMNIKSILAKYSSNLRRDFLAILVKLSAKKLNMYTVRNDWRTKKGMLDFLERNWEAISKFIVSDPAISWFCNNYSNMAQAFTDRKFAFFIQDNWSSVGDILSRADVLTILQYQKPVIKQMLETKDPVQIPPIWAQFQPSRDLFHIIKMYKTGSPVESPKVSPCNSPRLDTTEETIDSFPQMNEYDFGNFEPDLVDPGFFDQQFIFSDE